MNHGRSSDGPPEGLLRGGEALEEVRRRALREQCALLRARLSRRDPASLAGLAAMAFSPGAAGERRPKPVLAGHLWGRPFRISWPEVSVDDERGDPAALRDELLWLHYLDRADGSPLAGRAITLRELGGGGLFYQQAFQGYAGDELARAWGARVGGLARRCRETGGWEVPGPADLNFEWAVLPRVPVFLHYRIPDGRIPARATVLFDAAAGHYLAVDVAAVIGKELVDRLTPRAGASQPEETLEGPENSWPSRLGGG